MQQLRTQDLTEYDVKIHLACKNIFLSLSLGFYLKGHLSTIDEADFVITDCAELKRKYAHLPMCVVGKDLYIPCSVYEMFSQLHDFYSHVNAKQAEIFQKDLQHLKQNEIKMMNIQKINHTNKRESNEEQSKQNLSESTLIETIKQKKLQEIIQNTNPALSGQIETLFNELSQKIYNTLNQNKDSSIK